MDPSTQLKLISPYLDSHLLLHLLQKNLAKETADLQTQIKGTLQLSANKEDTKKLEDNSRDQANKLLTLLNNQTACDEIKKVKEFTFEKLKEKFDVKIEDCQALFDYAKLLYDLGKYTVAERFLFNLKEILAAETYSQSTLVSQVFWGLLACEILNQKNREVTELTTVRKIKDILKARLAESPMQMLHQTSWLLHWCLVFSFTAEKSNGLFAALLADKTNFGDAYLNVIQLRCPHLMRYMVASFLLGRSSYQPQPTSQTSRTPINTLSKDALPTIALPMILAEEEAYSDSFTQFTISLFEDFDFDQALKKANEIYDQAQNDILLRPHATELRRQALLYVFEIKCRLFGQNQDLKAFCDENKIQEEGCSASVIGNLQEQFIISVQLEDGKIAIHGNQLNVKAKINQTAVELLKRTEELNKAVGLKT